jgi:hypothetical protein
LAPSPELSLKAGREKPIHLDENVQFSVYRPGKIRPGKWYSLLAFAHLSERPPDADEGEPDPIELMEEEAERILATQKPETYGRATQDSSQSIPRQSEISFVPFIEGVEFNPPSISFIWQESVHSQKFRMRASPLLDGKIARGRMSIYLGAILLAEINLSIQVTSAHALDDNRMPRESAQTARPYRKIFPSYSHKDREIVAQIEHYAQTIGDRYMRDVHELRSGQNWKEWMREAIERADIFQLFWSTNSMRSENVRLEWEYALNLRRPGFIRPTYWENPLPQSPAENLPPPELTDLHFQHVRPHISMHLPPAGGWPVKETESESLTYKAESPHATEAATQRRAEEEQARLRAEEEARRQAEAEEIRRVEYRRREEENLQHPGRVHKEHAREVSRAGDIGKAVQTHAPSYQTQPIPSSPPSAPISYGSPMSEYPAPTPMGKPSLSIVIMAVLGFLFLLGLIAAAFYAARWLDIF